MTLSYEQLTTPITEAQAEADLIEVLSDLGFTSTSWQSGSTQLTIVKLGARLWSKVSEYASGIAKIGNNEDTSGTALARYSASVYDNTKVGAGATVGKMKFTTLTGEGPHSPGIGDVVVTDGENTYRSTEAGSFTDAAVEELEMVAETAGAQSVIPPNSTLSMVTIFAGVSVTNPVLSGSDTWMTTVGTDEEADPLLRQRNSTKWSTLGAGEVVLDRVVNLMINADPSIKKVVVDDENPRGIFTCDVYIGGDASLVSDAALDAAQVALDDNFFKNQTLGSLPRVNAQKSTSLLLTLIGTVYYDSNYTQAQVQTAVETSLLTFIKSVPIGGFNLPPVLVHVVTLGDIQQAIENTTGVLTSELTTPSASITLAFDEQLLPPGTYGLTYQAVNQDYYSNG